MSNSQRFSCIQRISLCSKVTHSTSPPQKIKRIYIDLIPFTLCRNRLLIFKLLTLRGKHYEIETETKRYCVLKIYWTELHKTLKHLTCVTNPIHQLFLFLFLFHVLSTSQSSFYSRKKEGQISNPSTIPMHPPFLVFKYDGGEEKSFQMAQWMNAKFITKNMVALRT